MNCVSCNTPLTVENHLCVPCRLEIENEIAELEEEDAASTALATAAFESGLDCRPCSEPFDSVLLNGLENAFGNDQIKWRQWAIEIGVPMLHQLVLKEKY